MTHHDSLRSMNNSNNFKMCLTNAAITYIVLTTVNENEMRIIQKQRQNCGMYASRIYENCRTIY